MSNAMTTPETSVVIRAFNEEKHLPALLEGIRSQNYQDFEVIVVDSGSFDRTREIAQRHCDRLIRIDSQDFTFGYSLNVGINACAGRYVAIVSAHTKPSDGLWLESLIAPLHDSSTAMVYGKQLGGETSKFSEIQDFSRTFGAQRRVLTPPDFFANNANSAIRKDLWGSHGFDETLPGLEDIEWAKYWMERGYQVVYEPAAAIYHIHEETWRQIRRRYQREGIAANKIGLSRWHRLPLDLLWEGNHLIGDLYQAARQNGVGKRLPEIVLFRLNKSIGTAKGLLDGAAVMDPVKRNAMFFDRICSLWL